MQNYVQRRKEKIREKRQAAQDGTDAYKGYLIKSSPMRPDEFHVSKGGSHITTVKSMQEAKKSIDQIATGD